MTEESRGLRWLYFPSKRLILCPATGLAFWIERHEGEWLLLYGDYLHGRGVARAIEALDDDDLDVAFESLAMVLGCWVPRLRGEDEPA